MRPKIGIPVTRISLIKKVVLAVYRKTIQLNLALHGHKYQYVFVLAHMRSGSTLLSHILANHPEFAGAAESHVTYKTPADLPNLAIVTCQRLRKLKLSATYVVDQINHDEYLTDETLSSPLIHKCVILIRPPEATLQSMISLFGCEEKIALDFYIDRLEALAKYGLILRERALLVEYGDLVDRTEETLATLTDFLGVTQPFKPDYAALRTTGRFGDPSRNIGVGRVIRTEPHKIDIGAEALSQASIAFRHCRERLLHAGVQSVNELT